MADTTNRTDRTDAPRGSVNAPSANPDAITGAPGSHPVGTGIGAAGAGAAGAAIGSVAGPIGTVVGAAIGAVAGGLAGKGAAEAVNPTSEDEYWRNNYRSRPYVQQGADYDDFAPAYRHGYTAAGQYPGRKFDDVEGDLRSGWEKMKDKTGMGWDKAKDATRDAYDRASGGRRSSTAATGSSTRLGADDDLDPTV